MPPAMLSSGRGDAWLVGELSLRLDPQRRIVRRCKRAELRDLRRELLRERGVPGALELGFKCGELGLHGLVEFVAALRDCPIGEAIGDGLGLFG